MKNLIIVFSIMIFVSCGGSGGSKDSKQSKLLSQKLNNTYWEMPGYEVANIMIKDGKANVSMSSSFALSNGTIAILDEDPANNFVVFNVYTSENNKVFGLSVIDDKTIKLSPISESNDIKGYKSIHDILGVQMVKKNK